MNDTKQKRKIAAAAVGLAAGLSAMLAWATEETGIVEAQKPAAMTVHIGAHGGSGIATKLNEMHAKMAANGWQFADMEVHTENGDTEGAWITYTKP